MTTMIILGILLLLIVFIVGTFNKFAKNRNLVKDTWSNIDMALKRRYDLIPNLVETGKRICRTREIYTGRSHQGTEFGHAGPK